MKSAGLSLGADFGENLPKLAPCFELREKLKCIECIGKSKIMAETAP